MTDKQLEKLGLYRDSIKLHLKRYWCDTVQEYIQISKIDTIKDILKYIFEEGVKQGVKQGKEQRSNQIMDLLTNDDLF